MSSIYKTDIYSKSPVLFSNNIIVIYCIYILYITFIIILYIYASQHIFDHFIFIIVIFIIDRYQIVLLYYI